MWEEIFVDWEKVTFSNAYSVGTKQINLPEVRFFLLNHYGNTLKQWIEAMRFNYSFIAMTKSIECVDAFSVIMNKKTKAFLKDITTDGIIFYEPLIILYSEIARENNR